jgi:SAM-dependent methyltransferase
MKPETGRNTSFLKVIEILEETYKEPINIVETGCIRNTTDESKFGDGWSTLNWEYYAKKTNSKVYVVDINQEHIEKSKQIVPESELVKYTKQDSIEYLQNFDKKIDFLFVDSFDYCGDAANILACHNHSLNEVIAAWDKLNEHCFILIDDVFNDSWDGKGKFSIPYLLNNGFQLVYFMDSQALLKR